MSVHSYGYRKGINPKLAISKMASILLKSKNVYTVELDIKKCFDNIPLGKEYTGVGLSQGTILAPIIANCYLNQLDRYIEKEFETEKRDMHHLRNYEKHQENWIN